MVTQVALGGGLTVIEHCCEAEPQLELSFTPTVKLTGLDPAVVGVPEIAPVPLFNWRPSGKIPDAI